MESLAQLEELPMLFSPQSSIRNGHLEIAFPVRSCSYSLLSHMLLNRDCRDMEPVWSTESGVAPDESRLYECRSCAVLLINVGLNPVYTRQGVKIKAENSKVWTEECLLTPM